VPRQAILSSELGKFLCLDSSQRSYPLNRQSDAAGSNAAAPSNGVDSHTRGHTWFPTSCIRWSPWTNTIRTVFRLCSSVITGKTVRLNLAIKTWRPLPPRVVHDGQRLRDGHPMLLRSMQVRRTMLSPHLTICLRGTRGTLVRYLHAH